MMQSVLSITFLSILWNVSFTYSLSACYSGVNKAQFCQPNFINIVQDATTLETNTCQAGGYKESICTVLPSNNCLHCNQRSGNMPQNVSFSFDSHSKDRETCWVSGKLPNSLKIEVTNVTINFDKLYEAHYVTIEFCGDLPDSIVLFKSNNYGQKWSPWHFFSSSCVKTFGMRRTSASKMERQLKFQTLDPVCFLLANKNLSDPSEDKVVAFNPMIGRNGILTDSLAVKEWTSLTTLKISIIVDNSVKRNRERMSYSGLADVTIGGRTQCFGHATELKKINDSFVCDCDHRTDGKECNVCLNTHNDQPWKPIFPSDSTARECQKCFCNNHGTQCTFDSSIYAKYNGIHGSRCINCQHHTTGPSCDLCAPGYYRDTQFPVNHTMACQKCKCHIIGANNSNHCDPINGNCHCKDGVEGTTCNRCKKGYHQTRSSVHPCVPDIQKKMMATEERCGVCGKSLPRIKFKKFCRREIMIKITVQSKEVVGDWTRFGVRVDEMWLAQSLPTSKLNLHELEYSMYPIWLENANIRCNCPSLDLGQVYLLLTKVKQKLYLNQPELIVDRKSNVLKWQANWPRRLSKFKEREKLGECTKFKYRRKYSRQIFKNYRHHYMNDS